jgi:RNA polymerase sigma-70 factor (ECF subfamily)
MAIEVTQETMVKALSSIHEFDPRRGTMLAWLTTLSRNVIRAHLREQASVFPNAPAIQADLVILYQQIATLPLPDEVLEKKETADLVRATLTTIPGNYNQVLCDFYFRDMDLKAISRARNLSESAVKSLLHRARIAFRETFTRLAGVLYHPPAARGG